MKRAVPALVLSMIALPLGSGAQPTATPAPVPVPEATVFLPGCSEPAWSVSDNVGIFIARNDLRRAIEVYAAAADAQVACAPRWRSNLRGQFNMLYTAAGNYNRAADLSARLKRFDSARAYATKANAVYTRILKSPVFGFDGLSRATVKAEMTANNDLIARRHEPR
jgi:hypothetical protein